MAFKELDRKLGSTQASYVGPANQPQTKFAMHNSHACHGLVVI